MRLREACYKSTAIQYWHFFFLFLIQFPFCDPSFVVDIQQTISHLITGCFLITYIKVLLKTKNNNVGRSQANVTKPCPQSIMQYFSLPVVVVKISGRVTILVYWVIRRIFAFIYNIDRYSRYMYLLNCSKHSSWEIILRPCTHKQIKCHLFERVLDTYGVNLSAFAQKNGTSLANVYKA